MNPEDHLDVAIRGFRPTDIKLIMNSWMRGWRASRPDWGRLLYTRVASARIKRILSRRPAIRVACSPLDTNEIYGYIVAEAPLVHFVYVKRAYRGNGIATQLLASIEITRTPILCSHWTDYCRYVSNNKPDLLKNVEI